MVTQSKIMEITSIHDSRISGTAKSVKYSVPVIASPACSTNGFLYFYVTHKVFHSQQKNRQYQPLFVDHLD